jgi:hypothetical protein
MQAITAKYDELNTIFDILDLQNGSAESKGLENYWHLNLQKAIAKYEDSRLFQTQKRLIRNQLERAAGPTRRRRFGEALDIIENILMYDPNDSRAQDILRKIKTETGCPSKTLRDLNSKYRFQYSRSFGHGILKKPMSLIGQKIPNRIYVSDCEANRIFKFSVEGEFLGSLPITLKKPMGMFKDDKGHIWICDFHHSRILAMDEKEHINQFIELHMAANRRQTVLLYPAFGCFSEGRIYLVLMSANGQTRRIISLDPQKPSKLVPLDDLNNVKGLHAIQKRKNLLYVMDIAQGLLFTHDMRTKKNVRIFKTGPFPYAPRGFGISGNHIFLSFRQYVYKITDSGKKLFKSDLTDILKAGTLAPCDFQFFKGNNRNQLFISDISPHACIHAFFV